MPTAGPILLDAAHAAFMQQGVGIVAASRDAALTPTVVRATGCRVSSNLRRVTLFVWAPWAGELLGSVRATGTLACVFCEVPSHRTIQIKATDASVTEMTRQDPRRIERYRHAFAEALASLGYQRSLAYGLVGGDPSECVGIAFTPGALFGQTPGPNAGEPLVLVS
jgi:hypothetical protein